MYFVEGDFEDIPEDYKEGDLFDNGDVQGRILEVYPDEVLVESTPDGDPIFVNI